MSDDKRQFVINIVRSQIGGNSKIKITDERINTVIDQQLQRTEDELNRAFVFLDGKMGAINSEMDRVRALAGMKPMVPIKPVEPIHVSWPRALITKNLNTKTDPELEIKQPGSYREPGKITVSELLKRYDIGCYQAIVIPEPVHGLTPAQAELVEDLRKAHFDCLFLVLPIQQPKRPGLLRRLVGIFSRRKRLRVSAQAEFDISQCCNLCYGNGYLNMAGSTHPQPCPVCNDKEDYE